jgi:hypothetical protein
MNDFPNQKKKKGIYKEYWEGISPENAFSSLDTHDEGMCVACKFGCRKKQQAIKRLDGTPQKCKGALSGYVFDR